MGKVLMSGIVPKLTVPSTFPTIGTALNDLTWEEIREISDAGLAANYFSVGDTKSITINGTVRAVTFSNLTIDAFIIGIDHNASVEGSNRIHFQIGKINGVDVGFVDSNYGYSSLTAKYFQMNTSDTNSGGWEGSNMRKALLDSDGSPTSPASGSLLALLPSDLRAVMKPVTKYTDNTGGGSDTASYVTATTDYLWLLSEFEVRGVRNEANSAEANYQQQYDYFTAGNSAIKYRHDVTTAKTVYWSRSVYKENAEDFTKILADGDSSTESAILSRALSPAFAV